MKYEITKESVCPFFLIRLTGSFNLDDLERCYVELMQHPEWKTGGNIVWDAQECTFDHLQGEDLTMIGKMTVKYKDQRGKGKAAWVVGREIDFAVSRMFEMFNEDSVIFDFRVFRNIEAAEQYCLEHESV